MFILINYSFSLMIDSLNYELLNIFVSYILAFINCCCGLLLNKIFFQMKKCEIIQSEYGPIKGVHRSSVLGYDYISFQAIPYMKQPVGKLRFKEPQEPEKWEDVFDATGKAPSYVVMNQITNFCEGQEDAGVINVYTKNIKKEKLFSVMVFVSMNMIIALN